MGLQKVLAGFINVPTASGATDATVTFTDVTTGNASTTKHGFLKKLPNDAGLFLDGTGAFTSPPSGVTNDGQVGMIPVSDAFGNLDDSIMGDDGSKITITGALDVYGVGGHAGDTHIFGNLTVDDGGSSSLAFGQDCSALADNSATFGRNNAAGGETSFVFGGDGTVNSLLAVLLSLDGDTHVVAVPNSFNVFADTIKIVGLLPTSDPAVEGEWWNDSGTVKISAG